MSEIDWLDDDEERGLESTAMTNREWLASLSDAQLAELSKRGRDDLLSRLKDEAERRGL